MGKIKEEKVLDADMREFYQQVAEAMAQGEKQIERVQPEGQPLEEWGSRPVVISREDVAQAVAEWDKAVPEAAGLLMARTAEESEEAKL